MFLFFRWPALMLFLAVVQAQAAVGQSGLPVLCNILRSDSAEVELLQGALECLVATLGNPAVVGAQQVRLSSLAKLCCDRFTYARSLSTTSVFSQAAAQAMKQSSCSSLCVDLSIQEELKVAEAT